MTKKRAALKSLMSIFLMILTAMMINTTEARADCPPDDGNGTWSSSDWVEMQPDPKKYCMPWYKYCCRYNNKTQAYEFRITELFFRDITCAGWDADVGGGNGQTPENFSAWYMSQALEHFIQNINQRMQTSPCMMQVVNNCADGEKQVIIISRPACITSLYSTCDPATGQIVWKISEVPSSNPGKCEKIYEVCWTDENGNPSLNLRFKEDRTEPSACGWQHIQGFDPYTCQQRPIQVYSHSSCQ